MLAIGYYDHPMNDLTDGNYVALFAQLTEKITTCCRRKFPAPRDNHIEALQLVVDELARSWRPEFTAREWGRLLACVWTSTPGGALEADCGQVCMEAVEMTEAYIEIEEAWRNLQQHKKTKRPEIPMDLIAGGCPCCGR
jgi:hypothetical protein